MDRTSIVDCTRRWIADVVIGLNFCPFAQRVFEGEKIRYALSEATDEETLLQDLQRELELLAATPIDSIETTLLIHPLVLGNFLDYNDFLDPAEALIESLELDGVVQLASFHPHYQFAESQDDVENFTNRSPYPMLHLLREASIPDDPEGLMAIPEQNIALLRRMGKEKMLDVLRNSKPQP